MAASRSVNSLLPSFSMSCAASRVFGSGTGAATASAAKATTTTEANVRMANPERECLLPSPLAGEGGEALRAGEGSLGAR